MDKYTHTHTHTHTGVIIKTIPASYNRASRQVINKTIDLLRCKEQGADVAAGVPSVDEATVCVKLLVAIVKCHRRNSTPSIVEYKQEAQLTQR